MNFIGCIAAIAVGADRVNDKINPFFYISMTTSFAYIVANAAKVMQISQARSKAAMYNIAEEVVLDGLLHKDSFVERELQKRQDNVIEMV
jgi:hypothetical protein